MLFRGSPSLYFQTLQVYKTCFQTSLTYLMTVLACIHNDYELFVCECLLWVIMRGGPNLCPVELQLIISDPPGLLGFQPLRSFLLHVILPQPVGLNHLLKGLLTAGAQLAQANTFSTHPAVWTLSAHIQRYEHFQHTASGMNTFSTQPAVWTLFENTIRQNVAQANVFYFDFLGLVLISPRTVISEKSILNLVRRAAMLERVGRGKGIGKIRGTKHRHYNTIQ